MPEFSNHFGDLLQQFVQRERRTAGQLAEFTEVPLKTIQSWQEGRVKRPRDWRAILLIAAALNLTRVEVDLLLKAANHRSIEEMLDFAASSGEKELLELLARWKTADSPMGEDDVETNRQAVFQAVPAPVYVYGRKAELAQLTQAILSGKQICVLQGMPGVGKTTLAAKVAYELRSAFPDGVLWAQVDKSDTMSILYSFAYAFGREVSEFQDVETRSAVVRDVLARKKCLIVLDSTYHTDEIHLLRPPDTSPSVVLITTTNRRVLDAEAEVIELQPFANQYRTSGLAFFSALPAWEQDAEEMQALENIVDLVGGLPLALRLVASDLAQSSYMSAAEYYDYLYDERTRLENLSDWNETSKDVRASFEMSYNRLPTALKELFCSLAVFKKAEFSVEAAAKILAMPIPKAKKALAQLETLSLIEPYAVRDRKWTEIAGAVSSAYLERYRLHTLLLIFAAEKLATLQTDFQWRALKYYVDFVRRNQHHNSVVALEWENIAHLVDWATEAQKHNDFVAIVEGLTVPTVGVVGFLDVRGYWQQAHQWLTHTLRSHHEDSFLQARLHFKLGIFAHRLTLLGESEAQLEHALARLENDSDDEEQSLYRAFVCEAMAQVWMMRDRAKAISWSERGIEHLRDVLSTTAQHQRGYLLIRHGTILARTGELQKAQKLIEEAFTLLPPEPSAAQLSGLLTLGNILDILGEATAAEKYLIAGVHAAEVLGDYRRLAGLWRTLAILAEEQGRFADCEAYNAKALALYEQIGDVSGAAGVQCNLAYSYLRRHNTQQALPLIEAVESLTTNHELPDIALHVKINRGYYWILIEEMNAAEGLLAAAKIDSEAIEEWEALAEILRLQAQIALHRHLVSDALILIDESLGICDDQSTEAGISWRVKGEILQAMGQTAAADTAFRHSIELLANNQFEREQTRTCWRNSR